MFVQVTEEGYTTVGEETTTSATFLSQSSVSCRLSASRNSVSYAVAISNEGELTSNLVFLIVYSGDCDVCYPDNVTCIYKVCP